MSHRQAGRRFARVALIGLALGAALGAHAQQIYRIVGPDGRVSYSDQPPPASQAKTVNTAGGAGGGSSQLPYELRQVANRYPVTLYSSENCGPCGSARAYLSNRGIPFTERTVNTNDDSQALSRITGGATGLPILTIGGQQLKGYSSAELSQYLDAAGYPKSSQLPSGYRNPPASPLVEVQQASATEPATRSAEAGERPARRTRPVRTPAENTNPAGIQF